MGLNFRCSHCGTNHDTESDSALTNAGGSIIGVPWFYDKRGTMHLAMTCLRCGTLHDAYGSPAKVLFSRGRRALHVERVFPIGRLSSSTVLATVDPPWRILWALVDRGFLRQEEIEAQGVSGGHFFLPTDQEAIGREMAIFAAVMKFAMYTSLAGEDTVNDAVLKSFVEKADEYAGRTEQTPFTENHVLATATLLQMLEQGLPKRELFRRTQQILDKAKDED